MQRLDIALCNSPEEAAEKGFVYHNGFTQVHPKKAVVVRNGTVNGNATVDFILEDDDGKKYVFMITANLLNSIPC